MAFFLPKAVLFDLDDTILAWSDAVEPAWEELCDRFAPKLTGITDKCLLTAITQSRNWFREDPTRFPEGGNEHREIVARALEVLNIDAPEYAQEIADSYSEVRADITQPFPGAIETLRHLRNENVGLALITSGDGRFQRRKVENHGLDSIFDVVLIEGELGYGKPDERIYLEALDQLGTKPSETWMVGDGLEWDLATAQRLGMVGIWVIWPASKYKLLDLPPSEYPENSPVRPDRIVRRISEILE